MKLTSASSKDRADVIARSLIHGGRSMKSEVEERYVLYVFTVSSERLSEREAGRLRVSY